MAEISVIVPLYNTEKLLPRCLDSILSQTFSDFEIVLVDDGSTDGSGALCDRYAEKDSRIHVIHQSNSGVGVARNTGLDWVMTESDSRWLCFVDSDDWVHPKLLEVLLRTARESGSDISACGYLETGNGVLEVSEDQWQAQCWEVADFYQQQYILATVPWGKLYAKNCYKDIRYPVGTYFDDEFVTYRLLFTQKTIPVVPAALYAYYINPKGITKSPWVFKRLDAWKAYEEQIAFFQQRGDVRMLHFRYRHYLENTCAQLTAAQEAPNAAELTKEIRYIRKSLRSLIRRAWKAGCIEFWIDFDMLYDSYPILTKLYRLLLELRSR